MVKKMYKNMCIMIFLYVDMFGPLRILGWQHCTRSKPNILLSAYGKNLEKNKKKNSIYLINNL